MTSISEDMTVVDIAGVGRALFVLPVVPESAPVEVRAGVAARRVTLLEGICPECGAQRVLPNRAQRRAMRRDSDNRWSIDVQHEAGCPAITSSLVDAMRRWRP